MKQFMANFKQNSMKQFMGKFKEKQYVQNILIEVVADFLMVAMGIIIAYYIKTMLF
jgi:hypothetical protein